MNAYVKLQPLTITSSQNASTTSVGTFTSSFLSADSLPSVSWITQGRACRRWPEIPYFWVAFFESFFVSWKWLVRLDGTKSPGLNSQCSTNGLCPKIIKSTHLRIRTSASPVWQLSSAVCKICCIFPGKSLFFPIGRSICLLVRFLGEKLRSIPFILGSSWKKVVWYEVFFFQD